MLHLFYNKFIHSYQLNFQQKELMQSFSNFNSTQFKLLSFTLLLSDTGLKHLLSNSKFYFGNKYILSLQSIHYIRTVLSFGPVRAQILIP